MRKHERYAIESPVTVGLSGSGGNERMHIGRLCDIGVRGARFCLDRPLPANKGVTLLAHFRDPNERVVTVQFEGVVTRGRQAPPYEFAVRFRKAARFIPAGIGQPVAEPLRLLGPTGNNPMGGQHSA
jgi:hypothetical protein